MAKNYDKRPLQGTVIFLQRSVTITSPAILIPILKNPRSVIVIEEAGVRCVADTPYCFIDLSAVAEQLDRSCLDMVRDCNGIELTEEPL